jgi:transposase
MGDIPVITTGGLVRQNQNGGFFQPGRMYGLPRKFGVGQVYLQLWQLNFPTRPSANELAREANVGWHYADKVITEIHLNDEIIDPAEIRLGKNVERGVGNNLTPEEDLFLLSLRAEIPNRPNLDYCRELFAYNGTVISSSFVSDYFAKAWTCSGKYRKPNLIPLDKFRPENVLKYAQYRLMVSLFQDHSLWNFLDEKHLVNKDTLPNRVRACPLTGRVPAIPVSGDFREAYNLFAIISNNPDKPHPIDYMIGRENGNAASFVAFIEYLLGTRFFLHDEILVMDNAAIHTGAEAAIVDDLLWNMVVDGRPLHVFVVYLPARAPELNPIELVFHILARRIRSFRYRMAGPCDAAVVRQTARVLNDVTLETILKCSIHCGY